MRTSEKEPSTATYLSVAGVGFSLHGRASATFISQDRAWVSFQGHQSTDDLGCLVEALGVAITSDVRGPSDGSLWRLDVVDSECQLLRCAENGRIVWRIRAPLTFEMARVDWPSNPVSDAGGGHVHTWSSGLIYNLLVFRLLRHAGILFHGAAVDLDGWGIVCAGQSGCGKSTIAGVLAGAGADVLTDERPVIRGIPTGEFRVHGTPWPSSGGFARNAQAPLRRIYFLEHANCDEIVPLPPGPAFRRLLQVGMVPWRHPAFFDPMIGTIERLLAAVPCAVLRFRPTPAVVDVIRRDLAGFT